MGQSVIHRSKVCGGLSDATCRCDGELFARLAHVDRIHQLQWRSSNETSTMDLATCSEDGTLKVLIVHVGTD